MSWMNTWEVDEAYARYRDHPMLGPAVQTLAALRDAANQNSDGWCYWPKPANAAAKLMELIQYDKNGRPRLRCDGDGVNEVTEADVRAVLRPIKAFRTRSGINFPIFEPGAEPERHTYHIVESIEYELTASSTEEALALWHDKGEESAKLVGVVDRRVFVP